MKANFFYNNPVGRTLIKTMQKTGCFNVASRFLYTNASKRLVPRYIRKNNIDMAPFKGQKYDNFASFFARKKEIGAFDPKPEVLVSPCDGMLSVYPITDGINVPMKGSHYRLSDMIPDSRTADTFRNGLCLVFRLQASDYHHFCCFDDASLVKTAYVPGQLHSVQPIACASYPVFRLNRRWWSILDTAHFGRVAQIEIGAMLVGGVSFCREKGRLNRGAEMGNFELAGSTIVLLMGSDVRRQLSLFEPFTQSVGGHIEVPVVMGEGIGRLGNGK